MNRFWGRILQVSYRGLFIQQIYLWTLGRRIGGGCWAHTNCMIKISGDMYEAWEETCVGPQKPKEEKFRREGVGVVDTLEVGQEVVTEDSSVLWSECGEL